MKAALTMAAIAAVATMSGCAPLLRPEPGQFRHHGLVAKRFGALTG